MNTPGSIELAERWRVLVANVLRDHLPSDAQVWVFGSRATGRAKRYSDLDLAIDAGRKLTFDEHASLSEALSESDLPYKVDVVDLWSVSEAFRDIVAAQRVRLAEIGTGPMSGPKPPGAGPAGHP